MIKGLHVQFGCLSSRYFYKRVQDIYTSVGKHTKPPVSLMGQVRSEFTFNLEGVNSRFGPGLVGVDHAEIDLGSCHILVVSGFDFFFFTKR